MKNQENSQSIKEFLCWRENLYHGVNSRKETVIELVDALSSNSIASSVVELSENPLFRRDLDFGQKEKLVSVIFTLTSR